MEDAPIDACDKSRYGFFVSSLSADLAVVLMLLAVLLHFTPLAVVAEDYLMDFSNHSQRALKRDHVHSSRQLSPDNLKSPSEFPVTRVMPLKSTTLCTLHLS
jgi:hypothetical protein